MRWDIIEKERLTDIEKAIICLESTVTKLTGVILEIKKEVGSFNQARMMQEIPLVKPIIRDAERAMKKEKQEPEAINMWKN